MKNRAAFPWEAFFIWNSLISCQVLKFYPHTTSDALANGRVESTERNLMKSSTLLFATLICLCCNVDVMGRDPGDLACNSICDEQGFHACETFGDYGTMRSSVSDANSLSRVEIDYLMWWVRGADVPALVTTSPDGTLRDDAGVIGLPMTTVLFGNEQIGKEIRPGVRVNAAHRFDSNSSMSAYLNGFYLGSDSGQNSFHTRSNGSPILARPFSNARTGFEDSQLVAFPDILDGSVAVDSFSELYGGGLGIQREGELGKNMGWRLSSGYRFLRFRDAIGIREDLMSTDLGGVIPLGTEFVVNDRFEANSRFHAMNLGLNVERSFSRWEIEASANLGLGAMNRQLEIAGQTDVTVPSLATNTTSGGLLAQPTNLGTYRSSRFTAVPEWRVKAKLRLCDFAAIGISYDLLLVPNVWRASEQIDRSVNDSQIGGGALVGAARPAPVLASQTLWAQGVSFSLDMDW